MKKKLYAAIAAAALAVIPATAASGQDAEMAQVTVVHGVPGLDGVSILAGEDVLAGLSGLDFLDNATIEVPAGTYPIAVSGSDSPDDIALGPLDLTFEAGMAYAVVAHLDEAGEPTASQFTINNAEGVSAFHTAAFPAVAVVAGGEIQADDLTNGNAAQLDLDAGTELPGVGVAAAGDTELALEAGDLTIPEGQRILAFAVGTPDDESLQLLPITIDLVDMAAPGGVPAGSGGLLETGLPMWVAALMVLGALGIAVPTVAASRRS
ncbi:MAG: DUF4397 domain-containing protein [Nitriliruptoraceae bacterium]